MDQSLFTVPTLGECKYVSPLKGRILTTEGANARKFVEPNAAVRAKLYSNHLCDESIGNAVSDEHINFELAGPREFTYFDPAVTSAAIVTCGGLCPGLNNVIRSVVLELFYNYGVRRTIGIRNGFAGMNPASSAYKAPIDLTLDFVHSINNEGGTVLGSSRGPQPVTDMVDFLLKNDIQLLFCIGGDGTQRGAKGISDEVIRRGLKMAVVGIPKTIDNDIPYVEQSFGYASSLEQAEMVIRGAHNEATSTQHGVGLVKLMGRDAGFIAAGATIASQEVNYCFVPEVPIPMEAFLADLKVRLEARDHAVVVVAEGAGQDLLSHAGDKRDASGNLLHDDIGLFLKEQITAYMKKEKFPMSLKYIDPSYIIRSVPANTQDKLLCDKMARAAVHAAMSGKTAMIIGLVHNTLIHVPVDAVCCEKKRMSPSGDLWTAVLMCTGQHFMYRFDETDKNKMLVSPQKSAA